MAFCESDRGEWGQICPDCGQRLPARQGRLRSWHSARSLDFAKSELASESVLNETNAYSKTKGRVLAA